MDNRRELDIIARTRAEVRGRHDLTGGNLFLAWGYPTAIILFLEFMALILWDEAWFVWLWLAIPFFGVPLMMYYLKKDYERTGRRTLDSNNILQMWIYVGIVSCIGGAAMGFSGVFQTVYCTFQALLMSMGCLVTGFILRFRPKTVCGLVGTALSFLSLFFQGDLWPWQLLVTSLVTVVTLIIPGHLYHNYVRRVNNEIIKE